MYLITYINIIFYLNICKMNIYHRKIMIWKNNMEKLKIKKVTILRDRDM